MELRLLPRKCPPQLSAPSSGIVSVYTRTVSRRGTTSLARILTVLLDQRVPLTEPQKRSLVNYWRRAEKAKYDSRVDGELDMADAVNKAGIVLPPPPAVLVGAHVRRPCLLAHALLTYCRLR